MRTPCTRDRDPHARQAVESLTKYPGSGHLSERACEERALGLACAEERENILSSVVAVAERAQGSNDSLDVSRLQVLSTCLMIRAMLLRERTGQCDVQLQCNA